MTRLSIQKILIADCERLIADAYFRWGHAPELDGEAEALQPDKRKTAILRGYRMYDGCPSSNPNVVNAADAGLTVAINSFVVLMDVRRFLGLGEIITATLSRLPPDLELMAADDSAIEAVGTMVDRLSGVKHLSWGKVTKVLHKKRPRLIPLVDSYVHRALWLNLPHLVKQRMAFAGFLRVYRDVERRCQTSLDQIAQNLDRDHEITPTRGRILSFLLWNWMGSDERWKHTLKSFWGTASYKAAAQQAWASTC